MSELPIGWIETELGNITEVQSGVGFPKKYQGVIDAEYPVYKVGDLSKAFVHSSGLLSKSDNYVSLDTLLLMKGKTFEVGSTLFAKIGEALKLNRRVIVERPGIADNNVMGVKAFYNEADKYVYRYLQYFDVASLSRSTTVPSIRKSDVEEITIPLPPLNEQIRIANKLDSILAKVDKAQARLDKIPAILKRFRQSVLAAATSGELTKEWREERSLLFSDWREFGFSELLFKIRSGSGSKPVDESENGIRILRSSAVRNLAVNYSDHRYLPDNSEIKELDYLSNDDLLFTRLSGSLEYVGNCARVQGIEENTVQYPDRLFCAKLKDPKQSKYLEMYFSSPMFSKYIAASIKSSAGHQRITLGVIKDAKVIIPSEAEQEIIVGRVNKLFAKASRIEKQYLDAKARLDRLTQSILAKAFRGELVPQDPNDEPAEKLLERIVAEKEQSKPKKTTRKRSTKAKAVEKE